MEKLEELTEEQKKILRLAKSSRCKILKINSVAGSGKTFMLVKISEELNAKGIYLAYNKAIATEASSKFGNNIDCMTTHSLAYRNTVSRFKLKVGFLSYRDISNTYKFDEKIIIIDSINEFCTSKYTNIDDYAEDKTSILSVMAEDKKYKYANEMKKILNNMFSGKIDITHSAYLKLFHILLDNGKIKIKTELLMIDESGDINPVTLEIFMLIDSDKKILVGDEHQNIYSFNNTINGFIELENTGCSAKLTKSFRCCEKIAEKTNVFMRKYLKTTFDFTGKKCTEEEMSNIKTRAYISRTNAGAINTIIDKMDKNEAFKLKRKAKDIFSLPLILSSLKKDMIIYDAEYKYIKNDVSDWYNDDVLKSKFKTPLMYIKELYEDVDPKIRFAIKLILSIGSKKIFEAYEYSKRIESMKNNNSSDMICTAHSSKGLEFDHVIFADDLNESIESIVEKINKNKNYIVDMSEESELMLYYVSATRALYKITNAKFIGNNIVD